MKQKKQWVAPKLIIVTRDSGTGVLKGCKVSNQLTGGPGTASCFVSVSCCEGPGCDVYPNIPSCTDACASGCPPGCGDLRNYRQYACSCVRYFQQTGMDCTVGGSCTCKNMTVS